MRLRYIDNGSPIYGGFACGTTMSLFRAVYEKFTEDFAPFLAGTVAFFALLSLFPILFLVLYVLAQVLKGSGAERALLETIGRLIPGGISIIADVLRGRPGFTAISIIGILGFIYGGSGVFGALEFVLNRAYLVKDGRSTLASYAMAFGMTLITGALVFIAAFVQAASSVALRSPLLLPILPLIELFTGSAPWIITLVDIAIAVILVYAIVPARRQSFRWLWPGWLLSTAAIFIFQALFQLYLTIADFAAAYGPIGATFALLLWLYYSSLIVIAGAELNAVRELRGMSRGGGIEKAA